MTHAISFIGICMAANQADSNALAEATGRGPDTFSVKLSASGKAPATHFACHARVGQDFLNELGLGKAGTLPPRPWADFGLTEASAKTALGALVTSVKPDGEMTPRAHLAEVLAAQGLQQIVEAPLA